MKFSLLFLVLFIFHLFSFAQEEKGEKIDIRHADSFEFDRNIGPDVRRFLGNVIFEHNDAIMYCDSAYLFLTSNMVHAYSNVHIERGDSLHMYGDFMLYNGNNGIGKVRKEVILEDKETLLFTDSLDFNTNTNIAYYFNGGLITNQEDSLESNKGYYYSDDELFIYEDSVVVKTTEYTIYTDTLHYDAEISKAYFFGPTEIFNDSNYLYCENGWYDTKERIFQFNENAFYQGPDQYMKGDSLFYNDSLGIGTAINNVEMIDTAKNIILKGNYVYYKEDPEFALVTDSAVMILVDENNDSLFLHADTLNSVLDSGGFRLLKAFYQVRLFKSDLQAKCDSLLYSLADSTIALFHSPVVWTGDSQIFADKVKVFTRNNEIEHFELNLNCMIITKDDTSHFNQIAGKRMMGYYKNNELRRIDVFGNGQSIYFTKDGAEIVGMNKAESTDIIIYMLNSKVSRINMIKSPEGTLHPLRDVKEDKLNNFEWFESIRPRNKYDIFYWESEEGRNKEEKEKSDFEKLIKEDQRVKK